MPENDINRWDQPATPVADAVAALAEALKSHEGDFVDEPESFDGYDHVAANLLRYLNGWGWLSRVDETPPEPVRQTQHAFTPLADEWQECSWCGEPKRLHDFVDETPPAALLSLDLHCENFIGVAGKPAERVYDRCFDYGRLVRAKYGADQACWPCVIRRLLNATPPASSSDEPTDD